MKLAFLMGSNVVCTVRTNLVRVHHYSDHVDFDLACQDLRSGSVVLITNLVESWISVSMHRFLEAK